MNKSRLHSTNIIAATIVTAAIFFFLPQSGFAQPDSNSIEYFEKLLAKEKELGEKLRGIVRDGSLSSKQKREKTLEIRDEILDVRKQLSDYRRFNREKMEREKLESYESYYKLNELLSLEPVGARGHVLKGDRQLYLLFFSDSVIESLKLDKDETEKIQTKAKDLFGTWGKSLRSAFDSGDSSHFAKYRQELNAFDALLKSELSKSQLSRLEKINQRTEFNRIGFRATTNRLAKEYELSVAESESILAKLSEIAAKQIAEGNRKFLNSIDELLPGYLNQDELDSDQYLIPLAAYLLALDAQDQFETSIDECFKNYRVPLETGMWTFPNPVYRSYATGTMISTKLLRTKWVPRSGQPQVLSKFIDKDLTPGQKQLLVDLLRRPAASRKLTENEKFENSKATVQSIEKDFLDLQLKPYRQHQKLRTLFSLGPTAIRKYLKSKVDRDKFEKRLEESQKDLAAFIAKTENKLYETLAVEIAKNNANTNQDDLQKSFGESSVIAYESLLQPLISKPSTAKK